MRCQRTLRSHMTYRELAGYLFGNATLEAGVCDFLQPIELDDEGSEVERYAFFDEAGAAVDATWTAAVPIIAWPTRGLGQRLQISPSLTFGERAVDVTLDSSVTEVPGCSRALISAPFVHLRDTRLAVGRILGYLGIEPSSPTDGERSVVASLSRLGDDSDLNRRLQVGLAVRAGGRSEYLDAALVAAISDTYGLPADVVGRVVAAGVRAPETAKKVSEAMRAGVAFEYAVALARA